MTAILLCDDVDPILGARVASEFLKNYPDIEFGQKHCVEYSFYTVPVETVFAVWRTKTRVSVWKVSGP